MYYYKQSEKIKRQAISNIIIYDYPQHKQNVHLYTRIEVTQLHQKTSSDFG